MNVVPVQAEDLPEIARWHSERSLPGGWPPYWLSTNGFWVPGLAAAWLLKTNSARAFIEDAATNPDADKAERSAALIAVNNRITDEARAMGFRYLIGTTKIEAVRGYARANGYTVSEREFSFMIKGLAQ